MVGRPVVVEADVFGEGHDLVDAAILWRRAGTTRWIEAPLVPTDNQRWRGTFTPDTNGLHEYTVIGWRDVWGMWRSEVTKKADAGVPIGLELEEGAQLVAAWAQGKRGVAEDRAALHDLAGRMAEASDAHPLCRDDRRGDGGADAACRPPREPHPLCARVLRLWVDREKAVFSAWYELMPRSMSNDPDRHGTFDDVIKRLPYVRGLGFDVLYFPPIHPIGETNRKGKNNTLNAQPGDVGSPYAIGSAEGRARCDPPRARRLRGVPAARRRGARGGPGNRARLCAQLFARPPLDPRTRRLVRLAARRQHPLCGEPPPKKYEDIVNVRFYDGDTALPEVWTTQRDIFLFWVAHGVKIFRVDNPHTKAYPFWEWVIAEVQREHPDVLFLAEAFTRPKVMHRLAKLGFTQSYSYFTWRNTKEELTEYMLELTRTAKRHTMRVNFFVNTPDINPVYLQTSGRAGFQVRAVLAASLAGNYGVYSGFELCEGTPIPGREEYLNSEKYEIRAWDWDRPGNIRDDIARINMLRQTHPALQEFANVEFYNMWNDNILYYGKRTADRSSFLLFAVNLDPHNGQGADFEVPLWELGLPDHASIEVEDLVQNYTFTWSGKIQHVYIDPHQRPYFIWRLIAPREHG
ncbi:MAG: alpha-1,4-glucan--maltose-1-phosphate maltosyltransferase [Acuticoccus sp.]